MMKLLQKKNFNNEKFLLFINGSSVFRGPGHDDLLELCLDVHKKL